MESLKSEMQARKKRSSRVTLLQLMKLIDFMMVHKAFATGKLLGAQGRGAVKQMWKSLAEQLNEVGPQKTVEQWQLVWKQEKIKTRKRNSLIKTAQRSTGNPESPPPLSEMEVKILNIIGTHTSEGIGGAEFGLSQSLEDSPTLTATSEESEEVTSIYNFPEATKENESGTPAQKLGESECPEPSRSKKLRSEKYTDLMKESNTGLVLIAKAIDRMADAIYALAESLT